MTFAQPLPWWGLAVALAGVAALAWHAGWRAPSSAFPVGPGTTLVRRVTLAGLRAVALLALLAIAMRPVHLAPDSNAAGVLTVLVDVSRSMGLADAAGRRRLDAAVALVRDGVAPAAAAQRLILQVLTFGERVQAHPVEDLGRLTPSAPATDVAEAVNAVRRRASSEPQAGVLLVSDGGFALPDQARVDAYGRGAPIFTVGVGGASVTRDREVLQLTAGDATVSGAAIDLTATLSSTGDGGRPMEVRVKANGRPVEVRRVTPAGEGVPTQAVFRVAPEPTTATVYTVELDALEGELTAENNRRTVLVPPSGRARRVLLLEGAPGYEHSFLKRALEQDSGLEVDAIVRKGRNDGGRQTYYVQAGQQRGASLSGGFPASRQGLFSYDAVIVANLEADAFRVDQLELLGDYVGERGGGLLVLGARSFDAAAAAGTPLEELLPVEVSDRRAAGVARTEFAATALAGVSLTADGERHPVMRLAPTPVESRARWAALPGLPWVASVGAARPGATVLATTGGPGGVTRPLVAVQPYGRGRVLAFSGEATWRWRMMLPSSDGTYATFWRQAARWLASGTQEPVTVHVSPAHGVVEIRADVRDDAFRPVRDASVEVRIRASDGTRQVLSAAPDREAPGAYRVEAHMPSGVAQVEVSAQNRGTVLGQGTAWTIVDADDREFVEPRRDDAQLARLAAAFGGRLVRADDLRSLVADLARDRSSTTPLVERDLWQSPWVLLALMTLLLGEWTLRRRWGWR